MANAETFHPGYKLADDAVLLRQPADTPLTALKLFVCMYVAQLEGPRIGFVELSRIIVANLRGAVVVLNSNFDHGCQPGYEFLVKRPKPPVVRAAPARARPRKVQGDGTCFNSAVEPILSIEHPDVDPAKVYKVKYFPTTGETQVPGVLCADLSDGAAVLRAFVSYLNELGLGAADAHGQRPVFRTILEQPKMLNYKFRIIRSTPRMLIDLQALTAYMSALEATRMAGAGPCSEAHAGRFAAWPAAILPPFPIRETKPPTDDVKVSFRFRGETRSPRINVFQEGKINILGADTVEVAYRIYDFFVRLFSANWVALICLRPRSDAERRRAALPRAAPAPPPTPPAALDLPAAAPAMVLTAEELEDLRAYFTEATELTADGPDAVSSAAPLAGTPNGADGLIGESPADVAARATVDVPRAATAAAATVDAPQVAADARWSVGCEPAAGSGQAEPACDDDVRRCPMGLRWGSVRSIVAGLNNWEDEDDTAYST
jgi:hypothetical protein